MREYEIPSILIFLGFAVASAMICYFCFRVIRKNLPRLRGSGSSNGERGRATFNIVVMVVPLIGFGFEFLYFSWKAIAELLSVFSP